MVKVKLFGTIYTDTRLKEIELEAGKISDIYKPLFDAINEKTPESGVTLKDLKDCLVAINGTRVSPRASVKDGDEVWFFTAVGGG